MRELIYGHGSQKFPSTQRTKLRASARLAIRDTGGEDGGSSLGFSFSPAAGFAASRTLDP